MQPTPETPAFKVLLIHGLNLKPSKMLALGTELEKRGMIVSNVELSGHRPNTDWSQVHRQEWLAEIKTAYQVLKSQTDSAAKIFLVAYSIGALLTVDLVSQDQSVRFDRAVFFSPALEVHHYALWVRLFSFWPWLRIPSRSPQEYRYNNGTTIAAYEALFESVKAIHHADLSAANVPTLVVIDPKDELVHFRRLQAFIKKKQLSQWKIMTVSNRQSSLKEKFHHLIVDSASMGELEWQKTLSAVESHLLERKSS